MTFLGLDIFTMFLIIIVPGIFADRIFRLIAFCRKTSSIYTALIFSLFIYLINIWGLFIFKDITNFSMLDLAFDCLQFTRRYILLSLLVGAILGSIAGFAGWLLCRLRRDT